MESHFKSSDAQSYYDWQKKYRKIAGLSEDCIMVLDQMEDVIKALEQEPVDSEDYPAMLSAAEGTKERFYEHLRLFENKKKAEKERSSYAINIARFTYPIWKAEIDPSKESYNQVVKPHQLVNFLCDVIMSDDIIMDNLGHFLGQKVRIVMIGKEYWTWLFQMGKRNSDSSIREFMQSITNEQTIMMLQKYHMDVTYCMGIFPVFILHHNGISQISKWKLSKETKSKIKSCLNDTFGKEHIWFPGIVTRMGRLLDEENRFYELAAQYFSGSQVREYQYDECKYTDEKKDCDFEVLGIPFITRYQHKTSKFKIEDALNFRADNGERDLLLEPGAVFFQQNDPCNNFIDDRIDPLATVHLDDYGIPDAICADLKTRQNTVIPVFCWGDIPFIQEMLLELERITRTSD